MINAERPVLELRWFLHAPSPHPGPRAGDARLRRGSTDSRACGTGVQSGYKQMLMTVAPQHEVTPGQMLWPGSLDVMDGRDRCLPPSGTDRAPGPGHGTSPGPGPRLLPVSGGRATA